MSYQEKYRRWLDSDMLSPVEKNELYGLDAKEIEERFYGNLVFGTAGLRGTMGMGTAKMNKYVVRHASQSFAEVILQEGGRAADMGVCICFDCRNNSAEFARAAAEVMAANGIAVRIFEDMRPTPELSFAIRHYGCIAGINVTASHNPKEYNGFKVYWSDGAQLPPKQAEKIALKMEELDFFDGPRFTDFDAACREGKITVLGSETDDAFMENVLSQAGQHMKNSEAAKSFKLVFTPFHGAGRELIPKAIREIGAEQLYCVEEQMVPDGNFSTVASPNPEDPEGFYLAAELADKIGADFILGSDPDADRVGIMIRDGSGKFIPVSGNLTGVLLLDYVIYLLEKSGRMPENPAALKSIVTTEMARALCREHGICCYDTFTGFKFMAEKKNLLEKTGQGKVIFSYEESYGYMVGDFARDKDAVTASMLLCEMALWYASRGMTVYDAVLALYERLGFYKEKTVSIYMKGLDGAAKIRGIMEGLRKNPPEYVSGEAVSLLTDHQSGFALNIKTGEKTETELKGADVLRYLLDDGTMLVVRPSGTEPKIKIYILTKGTDIKDCDEKISKYSLWAKKLGE